ncbi:DUF3040 domain-containing protein [Spirilliplanes yamanashiensis]|uniref:DUF3040 domain-containing protein n=1 Tax=Spirilliplanes yamanashiensis TaxID=42233 RepID=A0A8J3YBP9_9ACTN|nr:DUF3040 domain-containing protein [Spirilliplanes yamanashiensis]MDP9818146.1 hypothetical protein [Spirilliplanes yamanashiensis]GIJ04957.1 hypothetical protein Sya03_43090 [Spirilliplanes yamanashiensis]
MMSDAERRRLSDIELRLREDDPAFARRLTGPAPSRRRWQDVVALLWLLAGAAAACIAGLSGNAGIVVAALGAFAVSAVLWLTG